MSKLKLAVAIAAVVAAAVVVGPAVAGVHILTVSQGSTATTSGPFVGIPASGFDVLEILTGGRVDGAGGAPALTAPESTGGTWTNRSGGREENEHGGHHGGGGSLSVPNARSTTVSGPAAGLNTWHGLDHFKNRFGNGLNDQFSLEPPDQGLCVGGGQVLEVVNNVIQSYTPTGTPTSDVRSLNLFFGYPPSVIRKPLAIGPQVTDPSCLFDARAQKFIVISLTYDVKPTTGQPTGPNRLDIALTSVAAPTVAIQRYSIPVQNDGTQGTPSGSAHKNCPCVGDFPQMGMDQNGLYITTNEYPWFTDGFNGAQLYAISRLQLEAGSPVIRVIHFDNNSAGNQPAFTMWPAESNEGDYNQTSNGTENFLSSIATAAPETTAPTGLDNRVVVWSLRNTRTIDFPTPNLRLDNQVVRTETYGIPPPSDQKASDALPLRDCLNDKPAAGILPAPCSLILNGEPDPYKPEVEGPLDSSDGRMLTDYYVRGTLIGALDTVLNVGGQKRAGIAWFSFNARSARLLSQGYLAVANNNVIYPSVATLVNGKGAMAFTLTGRDYFPSAAYARVNAGVGNGGGDDNGNKRFSVSDNHGNGDGGDDNGGNHDNDDGDGGASVGSVQLAFAGLGPQDGFSEYRYYSPTGNGVARPRWGDFGGAASDGTSVWIASEYIGQTCTYEVWLTTAFRCGNTRTALANWGTRVTQVP